MSHISSSIIQDKDNDKIISHENELEHKRTVLDFDAGPTYISKYIFGTFIYIIIFVIITFLESYVIQSIISTIPPWGI